MKNHTWKAGVVQGFNMQACTVCDFWVVALPNHPQLPKGSSVYLKEDRAILLGAQTVSSKEADDLCKKYKVSCS